MWLLVSECTAVVQHVFKIEVYMQVSLFVFISLCTFNHFDVNNHGSSEITIDCINIQPGLHPRCPLPSEPTWFSHSPTKMLPPAWAVMPWLSPITSDRRSVFQRDILLEVEEQQGRHGVMCLLFFLSLPLNPWRWPACSLSSHTSVWL